MARTLGLLCKAVLMPLMPIRTVREMATSGGTPVERPRSPAEERAGAALPGDPAEPYSNRYSGMLPTDVLKLIRSGSLTADDEREARAAIRVFETVSGDRVTGGMRRPGQTAGGPGPSMEVRTADEDVLANEDYDPELEGLLWR